MNIAKVAYRSLLSAGIVGLMASVASCSSKTDNTQATEKTPEETTAKASRGQGSVVDKSNDATLQTMIKEVLPKFKQAEYKDPTTGKTMQYNLFTPANAQSGKKYPVVMFIADASTANKDVTAPLSQGYGALIWAVDSLQAKNPCYVLVPQFTGVAVNDAYEHSDEVDIAARLLKKVATDKNADTNRLYATGQSMGGMISMYYNVAYPDLLAASIFVDCHWDPATFDELVKHKFIFFIAGDEGKAYADLKPLETAAEKEGVQYTFAEWSAKLPETTQNGLAGVMLEKGAPINIFEFETGSVLPDGVEAPDHMYSFDYAYKIPSVRDWLFKQKK